MELMFKSDIYIYNYLLNYIFRGILVVIHFIVLYPMQQRFFCLFVTCGLFYRTDSQRRNFKSDWNIYWTTKP